MVHPRARLRAGGGIVTEGLLGMESTDVRLARIEESMKNIGEKVDTVVRALGDDSPFVTKDAFLPVKAIAYGLVALVMIGFVGAVVALVWKA